MSEIEVYKVCRVIIGEDGKEKYMSAVHHCWPVEYPLNGYANPVEGGLFAFKYQDKAETFMRLCGYTYVLFRAYVEPYDTSTTLAVDISYPADDNVLSELMSSFWSKKHKRNDVGFENLLTVPIGTIFMKTLRITEELLRYNDAD